MCVGIVPLTGTTVHKWTVHPTHPIQDRRIESFPRFNGILLDSFGTSGTFHPRLEIPLTDRVGLFAVGEGYAGTDARAERSGGIIFVEGEEASHTF